MLNSHANENCRPRCAVCHPAVFLAFGSLGWKAAFQFLILQGSFVTFEHSSNRVNIFYHKTTNLVSKVPKRG